MAECIEFFTNNHPMTTQFVLVLVLCYVSCFEYVDSAFAPGFGSWSLRFVLQSLGCTPKSASVFTQAFLATQAC